MTTGWMRHVAPCILIMLMAGGPAGILAASDAGRIGAPDNPPYAKARIPDFSVRECDCNLTMRDIDLFEIFSDPDLPPAGNDSLAFSVDNSTFPATITDNKLTFGQAPGFPGIENHVVVVAVTATDRCGMTALQTLNITVIHINKAPQYCECGNHIEILEDEISFFDLNRLFIDPEGEPLNFTYLGGASDNLSVEVAPDNSAVFRPADYYTAWEILRFEAFDPEGANRSGELLVRIKAMPELEPPLFTQIPDPLEDIVINEGEALTFRVEVRDEDSRTTEQKYSWFIDDIEKAKLGNPNFTWRPTFDDSGQHMVKVRISDGLSFADAGWNITVNDANRPPVILECWPQNNTEFPYGTRIIFCATASDPEGDILTFCWRLSDGTILKTQSGGNVSSFSKVLSAGKWHIVVLEVSDGKDGVARQSIYIKVHPDDHVDAPINPYNLMAKLYMAAVAPMLLVLAIIWGLERVSRDR